MQQPPDPRLGSPTVVGPSPAGPSGPSASGGVTAAASVDPRVPGTVLGGRYRVGECLGAGAMGVVWTAYDRRLRRTVAVKQLAHRDRGAGDAAAARLVRTRALREGRIAARVVHPRAIAVFDVVEHGGGTWLVMEYLPSRSLATVLAEQGPLEPAVVAHLGAQIADALAAVHEAGIVHGDVKPGNVLVTDDGVAKITDFGVSRAEWDATSTGGGTVAGTPGFFAPEVARGGEPTFASDVFSLGATLYAAVENELVCGTLDNTLAVLHAMAEARLRPATRAGVLGRPLAAMLRREPDHRPGPAALRRALRARATTDPVRIPARRDVSAPPDVEVPAARRSADHSADAAPLAAARPDAAVEPAAMAAAELDPVTGWSTPPRGADQPVTTGLGPQDGPDGVGEHGVGEHGVGEHGVGEHEVGEHEVAVPAPREPDAGGVASSGAPGHTLDRAPDDTPDPAPAARGAKRRRAAVVALAAASVAVLGGAGGVALASLTDDAPAPVIAAPVPTAPVVPSPRAAAPVPAPAPDGPATAGVAEAGSPIGDDEAVRAVTDYYGALPADPDRAWSVLSGAARDDSGGYGGYRRFWAGIREVRLSGADAREGTVRADVEFVTDGGRTSREPYRFELARDDDGRLVITSAQRAADAM